MAEPSTHLKPGDYAIHLKTGVVGQVKKLWTPNSYGEPPIPCECVEFQDGNILLAFDAEGPTVAALDEKEALLFRQMVALFGHTMREAAVLGHAMGITQPRAVLVFRAALQQQLRELSR